MDSRPGLQPVGFSQTAQFIEAPHGDLPDGLSAGFPVQPFPQKYSTSRAPQIKTISIDVPAHRGAFRDRHKRWAGMRWTRQRFARDGIAGQVERLVSDQQRADERCCSVRRSRVVLTPRRWRQVRGCYVGPTGLRHNVSPWTTVAKEPGHRGEREGNR
jgi:hypothetical protein